MKIHISESTKSLIEKFPYKIVERGKVEIKGKGEMKTYFILCKLDKQGNPIKLNFETIEQKAKINTEQNPVEEERGYSPVTFEEVRKSCVSLRKVVDEKEPEPVKAKVSEPTKQNHHYEVKNSYINDKKEANTNLTENGDDKKLNSVTRRSSIKSVTNGSVKSVTIKDNDSKSKSVNEGIIISYSNKFNEPSKSRKDSYKPVDSDSKIRTSVDGTTVMNNNRGNNNTAVLRTMKTQTCQLL